MPTPRLPFQIDLRPFMPADWKEQVRTAIVSTARRFETDRTLSTLGYDESRTGADLSSAVRDDLVGQLPWVQGLYEDLIPVLLGQFGYGGKEGDLRLRGEEPLLPVEGQHGVSANLLHPGSTKKGLEWHRDGADVRLALIVTTETWNATTGGRLMAYLLGKVEYLDYEPGLAWVVEASEIPHAVEELRIDRERICLMFNYTNFEQKDWRAPGETESFYNVSDEVTA